MSWTKLSDQEPPEGETVIITGYSYGDAAKGRWWNKAVLERGTFYDPDTDDNFIDPTHWVPGPKLPEE